MKSKRKYLWLLLIPLVAFALMLGLSYPDEPSYQGRRLSSWLKDLVLHENDARAIGAVQAMGTNAVPYLLDVITQKQKSGLDKIMVLCNRFLIDTLHVRKDPISDSIQVRYIGAVRGFKALGPVASNAVPELGVWMDDPVIGSTASAALSYIGPVSMPVLMGSLTNSSVIGRHNALWALAKADHDVGPAFPMVLACLDDTNRAYGETEIRFTTIQVLGQIQGKGVDVVPVLTGLLTNSDVMVRTLAAQSLQTIEGKRR